MPESPEKRRRERMKQQKRKDKSERRALRREGKRLSPMFHTLRRGAEQHRVETDLWLSVLDLVAVGGWTPPLSEPAAKSASSAYSHPHGLEIARADAKNLGQSIGALLTTISEDQLPPSNSPFGEQHTEALLTRRAAGEKLALEDASTAQEFLSGTSKREVERLATFLMAGPVSIQAN
jgi:hypothetical protein